MTPPLDVRPWFREDMRQLLAALHFMNSQRAESDRSIGFAEALIAMCLQCGIEPESIRVIEHEPATRANRF